MSIRQVRDLPRIRGRRPRARQGHAVTQLLKTRLILLIALVFLIWLTWHSARSGYAARLTERALATRDISAATTAASVSPNDAQAQLVLGALLEANGDRASAMPHYQTAVRIRPRDYVLRMQLARAEELEGKTEAAIESARVAVKLAPAYAQPHYQLGNLLVRAGRNDEGFAELRLAGESNPALLPSIIDLAWQISRGDAEAVKRFLAPQTPRAYLALGDYFKKQRQTADAVAMFTAAGNSADAAGARKQFVNELINWNEFKAAYQLWTLDAGDALMSSALLINPGFEDQSDLNDSFGWRALDIGKSVTLSLDDAGPKEGRWSLRADFNGESSNVVISQLVLVEAKAQYRLSFAVRTENLVSGGLPNVLVFDAAGNKLLGESGVLPQTTNGWREVSIDFSTGEQTNAIRIALQRASCPTTPCPIFGRLWLDAFDLRKSSQEDVRFA